MRTENNFKTLFSKIFLYSKEYFFKKFWKCCHSNRDKSAMGSLQVVFVTFSLTKRLTLSVHIDKVYTMFEKSIDKLNRSTVYSVIYGCYRWYQSISIIFFILNFRVDLSIGFKKQPWPQMAVLMVKISTVFIDLSEKTSDIIDPL